MEYKNEIEAEELGGVVFSFIKVIIWYIQKDHI